MKAKHISLLIIPLLFVFPLVKVFATDQIIGINEVNLTKIPIGVVNLNLPDKDKDGLDNDLEKSLGTNPEAVDSDHDGFSDKTEIENNYNPLGAGKIKIDLVLANKLAGKYLLRVEKHGELWYVSPNDHKRYLVNSETRKKLTLAKLFPVSIIQPSTSTPPIVADENSLSSAADKIRSNDKTGLLKLISPDYRNGIGFAMDTLTSEQRLLWANIISSAKLTTQTATEQNYKADVFFNLAGKNAAVNFSLLKQPDNTWLITNL